MVILLGTEIPRKHQTPLGDGIPEDFESPPKGGGLHRMTLEGHTMFWHKRAQHAYGMKSFACVFETGQHRAGRGSKPFWGQTSK